MLASTVEGVDAMPSARRVVLVLAAVAALVSGCATARDGQGSYAPPSRAVLAAVNVQQSDLRGWKRTAPQSDGQSGKDTSQLLLGCVGVARSPSQNRVADVDSDDFSMGASTISSSATSYRTDADVRLQLSLLTSPKAPGCLRSILRQSLVEALPSSDRVADVSVGIDTTHDDGVPRFAGRISATDTVTADGADITVYVVDYFLSGPDLVADVSSSSLDSPVDSGVLIAVTNAVAKRAGAA